MSTRKSAKVKKSNAENIARYFMKKMDKNCAVLILQNLHLQEDSIDKILVLQKKMRAGVSCRDWSILEESILKMNEESDNFKLYDKNLSLIFENLGIKTNGDFYVCVRNFSSEINTSDTEDSSSEIKKLSEELVKTYNSVRRKLIKSKVENESLSNYVKITNSFLQQVFAKAMPHRAVRYSRNGSIVNNRPESLVLNTVM